MAFESEHFRVHAYPDDWVCPRLTEWLEAHYAAVGSHLGVTLPPGARVDIYFYRDMDELITHSPCTAGAGGCARGREVFVFSLSALEHELVHAYVEDWGHPPQLFEEGLATMLQEWGGVLLTQVDHSEVPLEELVVSDAWLRSDRPYGAAGSFVRFLVERHGLAAYRELYTSTPRHADASAIQTSFAAAFGEPLDTALAAWRDGPARELDNGWLPVALCASPAVDARSALEITELVCGRERRSLSLEEPTGLVVRLRNHDQPRMEIHPCDGTRPVWPASWSVSTFGTDEGVQRELWVQLPAGRYGLTASALAPPLEVAESFVSLRWTSAVAESCEGATEQVISAETERIEVPLSFEALADGAGDPTLRDAFVRVTASEPTMLSVRVTPPDVLADTVFQDGAEHRTRVSSCDGACTPASCRELVGAQRLESGETYVLLLEGAPRDRRTFQLQLASP